MSKGKSVLFVCPYPFDTAGSQRFRHELYFDALKAEGIHVQVAAFWSSKAYSLLQKKGSALQLLLQTVLGMLGRVELLWQIRRFSLIYLHREATPFGPPWVEVCFRLLGKRWIFDFDDAIWTTDRVKELRLLRTLKWRSKVQYQLKYAKLVFAGNAYLKSYADAYQGRVEVLPTVVDTDRFILPSNRQKRDVPVVGWTGTHSTLAYLERWLHVLRAVYEQHRFVLHLICNIRPALQFPEVRYTIWSPESESLDLEAFDLGIMPLPDDPWTRGKCGFKAIQYMSKGIPAIASPVGVNEVIIQHRHNGMLASTEQEWKEALLLLLNDATLRGTMGKEARNTIERHYSKQAVAPLFVQRIVACLAN